MYFRDISKRSLGHLKTTWLLGQSINWKKDTAAAAAASTATASVPIPNEAAQSTQTLTAHFIHSQLVNNPQAGDALEYAPPLKKKGRIVFCACMYDTRKKQIRSTYTMYKETLKNTRWPGKKAPFSPFSNHTLGCFFL